MPGLLQGKAALVTGASSGIGRAAAIAFAREGARVLVADVTEGAGYETVKLIKDAGGEPPSPIARFRAPLTPRPWSRLR